MIVDQFNIFQRLNTLETNLNTAHFNTIVANKNDEDPERSKQDEDSKQQSARNVDDPNNSLPKRDLHSLYKYLFESDLKFTKDRTLEQLDSVN